MMDNDKISRTGLLRYLLDSFGYQYHHIPEDSYDTDNQVEMTLIVEKIIDYKEGEENGRPE